MSLPAPAAPATPSVPASAAPATPATEPKSTPNPAAPTPIPAPSATPDPAKPDASTPPDPSKPHKLLVNGKEEWISTEDAIKLAQIGKGANAKFEEAARMRKQNEQFLELLKSNPRAVLENPKLGLNFRKLAEEFLIDQINKEKMTPQEREVHEAREKIKEMEAQQAEFKRQQEEEQMQQLVNQHSENYERDIMETLKASDLPKTRFVVKQIAYYMAQGLKRGVPLKAGDVLPLVRDDVHKNYREFFTSADANLMAELMGEDGIKKLMEHQANKVRPPSPANPPQFQVVTPDQPKEKLDPDAWKKKLEEKFK